MGFAPYLCQSEDEARDRAEELIARKQWPCYFFKSDTTGEKDFEEFFTDKEVLDMQRFSNIGVIKNQALYDVEKLAYFLKTVNGIRDGATWEKKSIVDLFNYMLPDFAHKETGKYLDARM